MGEWTYRNFKTRPERSKVFFLSLNHHLISTILQLFPLSLETNMKISLSLIFLFFGSLAVGAAMPRPDPEVVVDTIIHKRDALHQDRLVVVDILKREADGNFRKYIVFITEARLNMFLICFWKWHVIGKNVFANHDWIVCCLYYFEMDNWLASFCFFGNRSSWKESEVLHQRWL